MNKILVEVSERTLDKISILRLKEKIKDQNSLKFISDEYEILKMN